MSLRHCKNRTKYESRALGAAIHLPKVSRQTTIDTVGELVAFDQEKRVGWEKIGSIMDGKLATSLRCLMTAISRRG